jgi:hypothetical protein
MKTGNGTHQRTRTCAWALLSDQTLRASALLGNRTLSASALLGAMLASGCAPDFIDQWEVTKPRIMTAKVVIDGDTEARARPRADEPFSIHYYLMSPDRPQASYTLQTAVCAGTVLTNGTLACAEEIPLETLEQAPYEGNDQLVLNQLIVPPIFESLPAPLDKLNRVAMFGAFCANGQVERVKGTSIQKNAVTELFQCVDNDDADYKLPLPFSMSVYFDRSDVDDDGNHHPLFACDEASEDSACVNGVEHELENDEKITTPGPIVLAFPKEAAGKGPREIVWEAWQEGVELPWDNCAEGPDTLPKVRANTKGYTIYFRADPTDREDYFRVVTSNQREVREKRREEVVVSHALSTKGGSLDGYAGVVRDNAEALEAEIDVAYTPPRQSEKKDDRIADSGRLVRFYFSMRDQRGGVDFTTRELCVLPPKD